MAKGDFKSGKKFEDRKAEVFRVRAKYPDRVPVVVEKAAKSDFLDIDKNRYLVPADMPMGVFIHVIRERIKCSPEKAIFVFIKNTLVPSSSLMSSIYDEHKDEDGFLYITYSGENTFGNDYLLLDF